MKSMNLYQPMTRLRELANDPFPNITDWKQFQADLNYVLDSHLAQFKLLEEKEKRIWYQVGSEGNDNIDISWRERAEELDRKLDAAKSVLWMAERYAEAGGSRSVEMNDFEKALEIIES